MFTFQFGKKYIFLFKNIHQNKFQVDYRPTLKCNIPLKYSTTIKVLEENIGYDILYYFSREGLLKHNAKHNLTLENEKKYKQN